jgi:hypothetical protein
VFLIDLDSRNGTALNDPLNKISRTAVQPGDIVFLGTHKVLAAELLAALPEDASDLGDARQATKLEASSLAELSVKSLPAAPENATLERPVSLFRYYRSARSWGLGIGLSAACVLVVVGGSWIFRTGGRDEPRPIVAGEASVPLANQPQQGASAVSATSQAPQPTSQESDERLVRKAEKGIYSLSLRTNGMICFTGWTAWAISPDTIVCSTNVLKRIEKTLTRGDEPDDCIVVCSPAKTLRVMKHSPVEGEGEFLSVGHIEAPSETVSFNAEAASAFVPEPGRKLAVLVAHSPPADGQPDNPTTISSRLIWLKIDQIQRDAQQAPLAWHCTAAEAPGQAVAAPVFDAAGRIVGCVESTSKTEVRVVPIGRLATLYRTSS